MEKREVGKLEWIDYLLSAASSGLAAYTVSEGIKIPMAIYVFGGLILVGTLVSAVLHSLIPTRLHWIGATFYFLVAIASIAAMEPLNTVFPEEGFPRVLLLAGGLSWMMSFGSFFLWSEATLTFQAVPAIALFGLVGAWDTFSGAPFAFFGFLICFAALFSRANARSMMRQAEEAGFGQYSADANPVTGGTKRKEKDRSRLLQALKSGPWRFMAGPEWALGSALVIVLFSLVGAPVVQLSMQGVAGTVRFNPATFRNTIGSAADSFNMQGGQISIGTGPRSLTKDPVFRAVEGPLDYYRLTSYMAYTGRGWREMQGYLADVDRRRDVQNESSLLAKSLVFDATVMSNVEYGIEFVKSLPRAPIVGTPSLNQMHPSMLLRQDGTIDWPQGRDRARFGTWKLQEGYEPEKVAQDLPDGFYQVGSNAILSPRLRQFFRESAAGGTTDFERATALSRAIGQRIRYDLDAPAVPAGIEPVEYTLFESRRGYCDLYATSMVLGARTLGMPARYVTGYYPANQRRDGVNLILSEAEAHAWAEIYFENVGWIPFDPTEFAENRTEVGDETVKVNFWELTWVRTTLVTLGLVIAVFGGWFVYRIIRRPPASLDPTRQETALVYKEFYKTMERVTGRPKRPSQTPQEYMEMVKPLLGERFEDAEAISKKLALSLFGAAPLESAEVQSLRRDIQMLRSRPKP